MPDNSVALNRRARRHSDERRRYASVLEAAAYLNVTDRAIRLMIADGRLTAYRGLGSRVLRIDLNEIDAKMESGQHK